MIGAIIGDMVGSIYEWNNIKTKDFPLIEKYCHPTDDSIMTIAVAKAILDCDGKAEGLYERTVYWMQKLGRQYPHAGYGGGFKRWLFDSDPKPYNSWGNGSAMRVSACGWAANSLEEAKALSHAVTCVTHDHPEGLKGAEAVACAIYLARTGSSKEEIRSFIENDYYKLDFTVDELRPSYRFDVSCQGTVPPAIAAFLEAESFEDSIRTAVSLGGDSDTLAAITGSIAEAFYGIPDDIASVAIKQFRRSSILRYPESFIDADPDLLGIIVEFECRFCEEKGQALIRDLLREEDETAQKEG